MMVRFTSFISIVALHTANNHLPCPLTLSPRQAKGRIVRPYWAHDPRETYTCKDSCALVYESISAFTADANLDVS